MGDNRIKGVPMRQSLDDDGCALVLRFFGLLLKIKDLNKTDKPINVGEALNQWNLQEFGKSKNAMTEKRSPKMTAMRRNKNEQYDYRREWLALNPNSNYRQQAEAWGVSTQTAYQWTTHERARQGRVSA